MSVAFRYNLLKLCHSQKVLFRSLSNEIKKTETVHRTENSQRIQTDEPVFLAAHVGAGYCRSAAVSNKGKILAVSEMPCKIFQSGIFVEMSSINIWETLVKCVKNVAEKIEGEIKGIGFTAIPALVCVDENGLPLTASVSRDPNINIILHYDTRSALETEKINKTRHGVLKYFGERVLPGLQESKLMWLKSNLKEECWDKVGHFFELTDFLTWKATGSFIRSSSSLCTQWTYKIGVNSTEGWDNQYFTETGIEELTLNNFEKIGTLVQRPGIPLPNGLKEDVAKEMSLQPFLSVPSGMPDGNCGCLAVVGCQSEEEINPDLTNRLCVIYGMRAASQFIMSREPHFVKGVNGPFWESVLPNMWLNQAGQTTAESALEYVIDTHPATPEIKHQIGEMHIHKYLNKILKLKANKYNLKARSFLTKNVHILPDFEGNKSPLREPSIRGMISGLSIPSTQESLAILYLATMQSLAYSTKHIISALTQQGHEIQAICVGGYLGKNTLLNMLLKDICQVPTINPIESKSKLLGAGMLAAVGSGSFRDFNHVIQEMSGSGHVMLPDKDLDLIDYHKKKYRIFLKMYEHQMEYKRIMKGSENNDDKDSKAVNNVEQ